MNTAPPTSTPLPLPAQTLLRQVSDRVRLACVVQMATAAWLALACAWLALYIGDRCGDTPSWLRLTLFEGVLLAWLAAGWVGLRRQVRAADLRAAARHVIAADPRLGHLLLSAVELAADGDRDAASRPLVEAALRQVADACANERATRYVSLRPAGPLLSALAICTAALLPVAGCTPGALPNVLARLLCPLAPIPRATQVRLSGTRDPCVVPLDEPSVLRLAVAAARGPLPTTLSWRLGPGLSGRAPVGLDGTCQVRLPPLERQTSVRLRCGDALARVQLRPLPRPVLTRLDAVVGETSSRPGTRVALLPGAPRLTVPAGTTVRLEGWGDRPLAAVRIWSPGGVALPVACLPAGRFAADLGQIVASTELLLAWASKDGLWTRSHYRLQIEAVPETPPRLRWSGADVPASVLPTALLTVEIEAEDDTGLQRLELHAGAAPDRELTRRADCSAAPRRAVLRLTACPADLGLSGGQTLRFEAVANDDVAGREPVRLTLDVPISAAAAWLDDLCARMRRNWRCLEQIAAAEARQADAEQAALAAPSSPPEMEAVRAAGERVAAADAGQAREIAADMDRLIAAALACDELDTAIATAWTEARAALTTIVGQSFPALLADLRPADPDAAAPGACLAAALPRRRDLAQALRAILAADDHFRRGAVRTAALRLLEAARAEQTLATSLGSLPGAWAGQSRAGLGTEPCNQLDALGQRQEAIATDIGRLSALLHDLAARGAPGAYGLVAEALDAAGLVPDLELAAAQIRRNHRFFALSTADAAAAKLAEWAAALDAGARAETGTAGGGQGGAPGGVGEVALRLRRALMAQEGLRERTCLVAQITQPPGLRQDMATTLALRQAALALGMPDLGRLCPGPLVRLVDQGAAAMQAAAEHLRALHFDAAGTAQAAASEWLTACLQQSRDAQTGNAGGSTAAPAAAGTLGLGQTGTRSSDEAPLGPTAAAAVRAEAWAARGQDRRSGLLRAGSPAQVPAPYRRLWEQYRRRLQEISRGQ